ncbi:MAG: TadE/TadG family type IV pilus assembly protein [bacterium]
MNLRKNGPGIVKDDRAQSLTEFAIVIPIVLLMFFAMLQYVAVVQAHQVGNYAAYVAARSYAVYHDEDKALSAAAMAFAPIARLMPGELTALGYDLGAFELTGSGLEKLVKGYVVAKNLRLNSSILGGKLSISTSGDPKQVDVEIIYPQPIYVPGLVELWNLVAGEKVFTSLKSLREGLGGVPKYYGEYQMLREQQKSVAGFDIPDADPYLSLCPHVAVRSKCSMGYEEWGEIESFRPRLPNTVDAEEVTDPALEAKAKEMDQARKDLEDAQKECNSECQAYDDARKATNKAKQHVAETAPGTEERAAAELELSHAQEWEAKKYNSCEQAKKNVAEKRDHLGDLTKT